MKTELLGTEDRCDAMQQSNGESVIVVSELIPDQMPNNE